MELMQEYYDNEAKKLHMIVDKILRKYGGISDKDRDDFYSLANEVFAVSLRDFDKSKCNFDGFLYSNLVKKIITEIRDRNRRKRSDTRPKRDNQGNIIKNENGKIEYEFITDISLDVPNSEDNETRLEDLIADNFNLETEVIEGKMEEYSDKMLKYLERLSKLQMKILNLIACGYKSSEIQEELHISYKDYTESLAAIHSYRNISVLL